jgi:hypothetical protein
MVASLTAFLSNFLRTIKIIEDGLIAIVDGVNMTAWPVMTRTN